ncbi:hypothetical protein HSB1_05490 [Halogranum salarium B-1]|uniref:Uncharacterized protein n=1 Tax=Halogranum salarium B-1 TaxID=1210908 RepID=J3A7D2_9EURY|nr:hypothetical protein HSB1_05490 [Halogranum salarium B-1]
MQARRRWCVGHGEIVRCWGCRLRDVLVAVISRSVRRPATSISITGHERYQVTAMSVEIDRRWRQPVRREVRRAFEPKL